MIEKQNTHNAYCNHEIAKANNSYKFGNLKINQWREPKGVVTSGLSKAMLARQLAALF